MSSQLLAEHLSLVGAERLSTLVVLGSGMSNVFSDAELTPVATLPTGVAGHRGTGAADRDGTPERATRDSACKDVSRGTTPDTRPLSRAPTHLQRGSAL